MSCKKAYIITPNHPRSVELGKEKPWMSLGLGCLFFSRVSSVVFLISGRYILTSHLLLFLTSCRYQLGEDIPAWEKAAGQPSHVHGEDFLPPRPLHNHFVPLRWFKRRIYFVAGTVVVVQSKVRTTSRSRGTREVRLGLATAAHSLPAMRNHGD